MLKKMGNIEISLEEMKQGLLRASWPGRFECVSMEPLFYLDGAHNLDGAIKLNETLTGCFPNKKKIGIMGVMADKEYSRMIQTLGPLFSQIFTVTPDHPRSLPGGILAGEIRKQGMTGIFVPQIKDAVSEAYTLALREGAMVMVFGSLYYLLEVKEALHDITGD